MEPATAATIASGISKGLNLLKKNPGNPNREVLLANRELIIGIHERLDHLEQGVAEILDILGGLDRAIYQGSLKAIATGIGNRIGGECAAYMRFLEDLKEIEAQGSPLEIATHRGLFDSELRQLIRDVPKLSGEYQRFNNATDIGIFTLILAGYYETAVKIEAIGRLGISEIAAKNAGKHYFDILRDIDLFDKDQRFTQIYDETAAQISKSFFYPRLRASKEIEIALGHRDLPDWESEELEFQSLLPGPLPGEIPDGVLDTGIPGVVKIGLQVRKRKRVHLSQEIVGEPPDYPHLPIRNYEITESEWEDVTDQPFLTRLDSGVFYVFENSDLEKKYSNLKHMQKLDSHHVFSGVSPDTAISTNKLSLERRILETRKAKSAAYGFSLLYNLSLLARQGQQYFEKVMEGDFSTDIISVLDGLLRRDPNEVVDWVREYNEYLSRLSLESWNEERKQISRKIREIISRQNKHLKRVFEKEAKAMRHNKFISLVAGAAQLVAKYYESVAKEQAEDELKSSLSDILNAIDDLRQENGDSESEYDASSILVELSHLSLIIAQSVQIDVVQKQLLNIEDSKSELLTQMTSGEERVLTLAVLETEKVDIFEDEADIPTGWTVVGEYRITA